MKALETAFNKICSRRFKSDENEELSSNQIMNFRLNIEETYSYDVSTDKIICHEKIGVKILNYEEGNRFLFEAKKLLMQNREQLAEKYWNCEQQRQIDGSESRHAENFSKLFLGNNYEVQLQLDKLSMSMKSIRDVISILQYGKNITYGDSLSQQIDILIQTFEMFQSQIYEKPNGYCHYQNFMISPDNNDLSSCIEQASSSINETTSVNVVEFFLAIKSVIVQPLTFLEKLKSLSHELRTFKSKKLREADENCNMLVALLIRRIQLLGLFWRKKSLQASIGQCGPVDEEIRALNCKRRSLIVDVDCSTFPTSDDELIKFDRIFKAQQAKTYASLKQGSDSAREKSKCCELDHVLRRRTFEYDAEVKELTMINKALEDTEITRSTRVSNVRATNFLFGYTHDDRLATMEYREDMLDSLKHGLKCEKIKIDTSIQNAKTEMNDLNHKMNKTIEDVRNGFSILSRKVSKFKKEHTTLHQTIQELIKAQEFFSRKEEALKNLKDTALTTLTSFIFEKVGGYNGPVDEYRHEICVQKGFEGCYYKRFLKIGVTYIVNRLFKGVALPSKVEYIKYLHDEHNAVHSATPKGHQKDLENSIDIVNSMFVDWKRQFDKDRTSLEDEIAAAKALVAELTEKVKNLTAKKNKLRDDLAEFERQFWKDLNLKRSTEETVRDKGNRKSLLESKSDALNKRTYWDSVTDYNLTEQEKVVNELDSLFDSISQFTFDDGYDCSYHQLCVKSTLRVDLANQERLLINFGHATLLNEEKENCRNFIESIDEEIKGFQKDLDELSKLIDESVREVSKLENTLLTELGSKWKLQHEHVNYELGSDYGLVHQIDVINDQIKQFEKKTEAEVKEWKRSQVINCYLNLKILELAESDMGVLHPMADFALNGEEPNLAYLLKDHCFKSCQTSEEMLTMDQPFNVANRCNVFSILEKISRRLASDLTIMDAKPESILQVAICGETNSHCVQFHYDFMIGTIQKLLDALQEYYSKIEKIKESSKADQDALKVEKSRHVLWLKEQKPILPYLGVCEWSADLNMTTIFCEACVDMVISKPVHPFNTFEIITNRESMALSQFCENASVQNSSISQDILVQAEETFGSNISAIKALLLDMENVLSDSSTKPLQMIYQQAAIVCENRYLQSLIHIKNLKQEISSKTTLINDCRTKVKLLEAAKAKHEVEKVKIEKIRSDICNELSNNQNDNVIDILDRMELGYKGLLKKWKEEKQKWKEEKQKWKSFRMERSPFHRSDTFKTYVQDHRNEIMKAIDDDITNENFKSFKLGFAYQSPIHRDCRGISCTCDYGSFVSQVYKKIITMILEGTISLAQVQRRTLSEETTLLNIEHACSTLHYQDNHSGKNFKLLKRLIRYCFKEILVRYRSATLEMEVQLFEGNVKAFVEDHRFELFDSIYKEDIESKLNTIKEYKSIYQSSVKNEDSREGALKSVLSDNVQEELNAFHRSQFKESLSAQVDVLSNFINEFATEFVKASSGQNNSFADNAIRAIMICFSVYFDELNEYPVPPGESTITVSDGKEILLRIGKCLSKEKQSPQCDSKFAKLIKSKRPMYGAIDYLISTMQYLKNKQHGQLKIVTEMNDIQQFFRNVCHKQREFCRDNIQLELKEIEMRLSELHILRKSLISRKDLVGWESELSDVEICISTIENQMEMFKLQSRSLTLQNIIGKSEDFYGFELSVQQPQVFIQLAGKSREEKVEDIAWIDKVRKYTKFHDLQLLEQQIRFAKIREEHANLLSKQAWDIDFQRIEERLLLRGMALMGFDSFFSGSKLTSLESLLAVLISTILEQLTKYQHNGNNSTSERLEEFVCRIRDKCRRDEGIEIVDICNNEGLLGEIVDAVNVYFGTDSRRIRSVQLLINFSRPFVTYNSSPLHDGARVIDVTIVVYESIFFALIPFSMASPIANNCSLKELNVMLSQTRAALSVELFHYLVHDRLAFSGFDLSECELEAAFDAERQATNAILSLEAFVVQFCSVLRPLQLSDETAIDERIEYVSREKAHILMLCLSRIYSIVNVFKPREQYNVSSDYLKMLKNMYLRALQNIIMAEETRRKQTFAEKAIGNSAQGQWLEQCIADAEQDEMNLNDLIGAQLLEIQKNEESLSALRQEQESSLLFCKSKMYELESMKRVVFDKVATAQQELKSLLENETMNITEINAKKESITQLSAELVKIKKELEAEKHKETALYEEIQTLNIRRKSVAAETERLREDKTRADEELKGKQQEIVVMTAFSALVVNLRTYLGNLTTQNDILRFRNPVCEDVLSLQSLFGKWKHDNTLWAVLTLGIDKEAMQLLVDFIESGRRIGKIDMLHILQMITKTATDCSSELQGRVFKVSCINGVFSAVVDKLYESVQNTLQAKYGISVVNGNLASTAVPGPLNQIDCPQFKNFVQKRIELSYPHEQIESKNLCSAIDAATVINTLEIPFNQILHCFIDEIELLAGGKLYMDNCKPLYGIDITIRCSDMEVGPDCILNSSGVCGNPFKNSKAPDGKTRRILDKPDGANGFDGYDGENGSNGGNIVMKVTNPIVNLKNFISIDVSGGDSGQGQLGGDGDEGRKGIDGEPGKAKSPKFYGGTCMGFGKPGTPGGSGGMPGLTGRSGTPGKAGEFHIEHPGADFSGNVIDNNGKEAEDILAATPNDSKPKGGIGGAPGRYGMDEISSKRATFCSTKRITTVVDRGDLISKHQNYKEAVLEGKHISYSKSLVGLIAKGSVVGVLMGPVAGVIFGVFGLFAKDYRMDYKQSGNPDDYRDRDKANDSKRGQSRKNERSALRNHQRQTAEEKRQVRNADSLEQGLSELIAEAIEKSGVNEREETLAQLGIDADELTSAIDSIKREQNQYEAEGNSIAQRINMKVTAREQCEARIAALQNQQGDANDTLENNREVIANMINDSQRIRDRRGEQEGLITQFLAQVEVISTQGELFQERQQELTSVIDEYVAAMQGRLKNARASLKNAQREQKLNAANLARMRRDLNALHSAKHNDIDALNLDINEQQEEQTTVFQQRLEETADYNINPGLDYHGSDGELEKTVADDADVLPSLTPVSWSNALLLPTDGGVDSINVALRESLQNYRARKKHLTAVDCGTKLSNDQITTYKKKIDVVATYIGLMELRGCVRFLFQDQIRLMLSKISKTGESQSQIFTVLNMSFMKQICGKLNSNISSQLLSEINKHDELLLEFQIDSGRLFEIGSCFIRIFQHCRMFYPELSLAPNAECSKLLGSFDPSNDHISGMQYLIKILILMSKNAYPLKGLKYIARVFWLNIQHFCIRALQSHLFLESHEENTATFLELLTDVHWNLRALRNAKYVRKYNKQLIHMLSTVKEAAKVIRSHSVSKATSTLILNQLCSVVEAATTTFELHLHQPSMLEIRKLLQTLVAKDQTPTVLVCVVNNLPAKLTEIGEHIQNERHSAVEREILPVISINQTASKDSLTIENMPETSRFVEDKLNELMQYFGRSIGQSHMLQRVLIRLLSDGCKESNDKKDDYERAEYLLKEYRQKITNKITNLTEYNAVDNNPKSSEEQKSLEHELFVHDLFESPRDESDLAKPIELDIEDIHEILRENSTNESSFIQRLKKAYDENCKEKIGELTELIQTSIKLCCESAMPPDIPFLSSFVFALINHIEQYHSNDYTRHKCFVRFKCELLEFTSQSNSRNGLSPSTMIGYFCEFIRETSNKYIQQLRLTGIDENFQEKLCLSAMIEWAINPYAKENAEPSANDIPENRRVAINSPEDVAFLLLCRWCLIDSCSKDNEGYACLTEKLDSLRRNRKKTLAENVVMEMLDHQHGAHLERIAKNSLFDVQKYRSILNQNLELSIIHVIKQYQQLSSIADKTLLQRRCQRLNLAIQKYLRQVEVESEDNDFYFQQRNFAIKKLKEQIDSEVERALPNDQKAEKIEQVVGVNLATKVFKNCCSSLTESILNELKEIHKGISQNYYKKIDGIPATSIPIEDVVDEMGFLKKESIEGIEIKAVRVMTLDNTMGYYKLSKSDQVLLTNRPQEMWSEMQSLFLFHRLSLLIDSLSIVTFNANSFQHKHFLETCRGMLCLLSFGGGVRNDSLFSKDKCKLLQSLIEIFKFFEKAIRNCMIFNEDDHKTFFNLNHVGHSFLESLLSEFKHSNDSDRYNIEKTISNFKEIWKVWSCQLMFLQAADCRLIDEEIGIFRETCMKEDTEAIPSIDEIMSNLNDIGTMKQGMRKDFDLTAIEIEKSLWKMAKTLKSVLSFEEAGEIEEILILEQWGAVVKLVKDEKINIAYEGVLGPNIFGKPRTFQEFINFAFNKTREEQFNWKPEFFSAMDNNRVYQLSLIVRENQAWFTYEHFHDILEALSGMQAPDWDSVIQFLELFIDSRYDSYKAGLVKKHTIDDAKDASSLHQIQQICDAVRYTIMVAFDAYAAIWPSAYLKPFLNFVNSIYELEGRLVEIDQLLCNYVIRDILHQSVDPSSNNINIVGQNLLKQSSDSQNNGANCATLVDQLGMILKLPESFYCPDDQFQPYRKALDDLELIVFADSFVADQAVLLQELCKAHVYQYFVFFMKYLVVEHKDQDDIACVASNLSMVLSRAYKILMPIEFSQFKKHDWFSNSILRMRTLPKVDASTEVSVSETKSVSIDHESTLHIPMPLELVGTLISSAELFHLEGIIALHEFDIVEKHSIIAVHETGADFGKAAKNAVLKIGTLKDVKSQEIFQDEPIQGWLDELITRRLTLWRRRVVALPHLKEDRAHDKVDQNFKEVLESFFAIQSERDPAVIDMFKILDIILKNNQKFSCLKELQATISAISLHESFDKVEDTLRTGKRGTVSVDIVMMDLIPECPSDEPRLQQHIQLQNVLSTLKYALYHCEFKDVSYFCTIFPILMRQLKNFDDVTEIIELITESKVYELHQVLIELVRVELLSWKVPLIKLVLKNSLKCIKAMENARDGIVTGMVEALYQIRVRHKKPFVDYFLKNLKDVALLNSSYWKLTRLMQTLASGCLIQDIDDNVLLGSNINEWEAKLLRNRSTDGAELSQEQILKIMSSPDKIHDHGINHTIAPHFLAAQDMLKRISMASEKKLVLDDGNSTGNSKAQTGENIKAIQCLSEEDILIWVKSFQNQHSLSLKTLLWCQLDNDGKDDVIKPSHKDVVAEILAVIMRAVEIYCAYKPRDTQLLAVLFFINCDQNGRLCNISTGEGKSLTTVMLATCLAIVGMKVDVVTSSKVLAIRDSEMRIPGSKDGFRGFYAMFGIKATNNCDDLCENSGTGDFERKTRYQECTVFYGEAGYFQRDILLSKYFGKDIRAGEAIGEVLILDEVDNMMVDNAVKTLYISHTITDMRHLKDLFLQIWLAVNAEDQKHFTKANVLLVVQFIKKHLAYAEQFEINFIDLEKRLADICDLSIFCGKKMEITEFLLGRRSVLLESQWEIKLKHNTVILKEDICDGLKWIACEGDLESNCSDSMKAKLNELFESLRLQRPLPRGNYAERDHPFEIQVPSTLHNLIDENLRTWIENAYFAKYITMDDSYIVGDSESRKQGEIIIMDKDTGVEQSSSKWSRGLHQFIQLKHNGALSNESLKAIYISNMDYFLRYKRLYGMSGTIGGEAERSLLKDTYNVDFFEIPRFKEYLFQEDIVFQSVSGTENEWLERIVQNIDENMDQQLLVTEDDVKEMEKKAKSVDNQLKSMLKRIQDLEKKEARFKIVKEIVEKEIYWMKSLKSLVIKLIQLSTEDAITNFGTLAAQMKELTSSFSLRFAMSPEELKIRIRYETRVLRQIEELSLHDYPLPNSSFDIAGERLKLLAERAKTRSTVKKEFYESPKFDEDPPKYTDKIHLFESLLVSKDIDKILSKSTSSKEKIDAVERLKKTSIDVLDEVNYLGANDFAVLSRPQSDGDKLHIQLTLAKQELDQLTKLSLYQQELLKTEVGAKRKNCRRAILVICENISELEKIESHVRKSFPVDKYFNVYKYDRAYRKFDKSLLEDGDVIVATNIAGRGTDLDINEIVKHNGGLHVILSFMPKNERVEQQAFGRSARAGNVGSGVFIVYDARKLLNPNLSIFDLRAERDSLESVRITNIVKKDFPRIVLEDKLFLHFNSLREEIESILKKQPWFTPSFQAKWLQLQIDSLKNHWAVWLNSIDKLLHKETVENTEREVFDGFANFRQKMLNFCIVCEKNTYQLIQEPGELNKIGKLFLDNEYYSAAKRCFYHIINKFPDFSEMAHYYLAVAIIHLEGGTCEPKKKCKKSLKKALSLLENHRSKVLGRNQLLSSIDQLTRNNRGLQSNYFGLQNEGEAQVVSVFINSIYTSIGQPVNEDTFTQCGVVGDEVTKLYDRIIKDKPDNALKSILKSYRISKKCLVARQVLVRDFSVAKQWISNRIAELETILNSSDEKDTFVLEQQWICSQETSKLRSLQANLSKYINNTTEYVVSNGSESMIIDLHSLESLGILSSRYLYRSSSYEGKDTPEFWKTAKRFYFPENFQYCEGKVLDLIESKLFEARKVKDDFTKRLINTSSFAEMMITKFMFISAVESFVSVDRMIEIDSDVATKLLGEQEHPSLFGMGNKIKKLLKRLKPKDSHSRVATDQPPLDTGKTNEDNQAPYIPSGPLRYSAFVEIVQKETNLDLSQIDEAVRYLEHHERILIDFTVLERKVIGSNHIAVFQGKMNKIEQFLTGKTGAKLKNGSSLFLVDKKYYDKSVLEEALQSVLAENRDQEADIRSDTLFSGLMQQLGFNSDHNKLNAVKCYNQYSIPDEQNSKWKIVKDHFETIRLDLTHFSHQADGTVAGFKKFITSRINQLDLSIHKQLNEKADNIKKILISKDGIFAHSDFQEFLSEDEFCILRAILQDAGFLGKRTLLQKLTNDQTSENSEIEILLTRLYQNQNTLDDKDGNLYFKTPEEGSKELYNRFLEDGIMKPPKVNIKVVESRHFSTVETVFSDNRTDDDPTKRLELIRDRIEPIVCDLFKLKRKKESVAHIIDDNTGGLFGKESENKVLDEKIESILKAIKDAAGTIKTMPQIQIKLKDLRAMFSQGQVPPELMDYLLMMFDSIIDVTEYKGFDWDVFLCAMIGFAQIVVGATLEIVSGGALHHFASALIAEGVGDIMFALQAHYNGDFSWKSYRQHKIQSLAITLITGGLGAYLSSGAKTTFDVTFATKAAITKAILKEIAMHSLGAVISAGIQIGINEISNVIMEEIIDTQFMQNFDNWVTSDPSYILRQSKMEERFLKLYETYGNAAKQLIRNASEASLKQLMIGSFGDRLFNQVSRLVKGIGDSFASAGQKLGKGNAKAAIFASIGTWVSRAVQLASVGKTLMNLCSLCGDFYDVLDGKLNQLENDLKSRNITVDATTINQQMESNEFRSLTKDDMKTLKDQLHNAFKDKVKAGFLQPAVGAIVNMVAAPIKETILSPFSNAKEELMEHIEEQVSTKLADTMMSSETRIPPLTNAQKVALQARGLITDPSELNEVQLNRKVSNLNGQTVTQLMEEHGNGVKVIVVQDEIYAILPTHKNYWDSVANGSLQACGSIHIHATQLLFREKIHVVDDENSLSSRSDLKAGDLVFVREKGENGGVGHISPMELGEDGTWQKIDIPQKDGLTDKACFAQSVIYSRERKKGVTREDAMKTATEKESVQSFYKKLGKFAKHNASVKQAYLGGGTVHSRRMLVGTKKNQNTRGNYGDLSTVGRTDFLATEKNIPREGQDLRHGLGEADELRPIVQFLQKKLYLEGLALHNNDKNAAEQHVNNSLEQVVLEMETIRQVKNDAYFNNSEPTPFNQIHSPNTNPAVRLLQLMSSDIGNLRLGHAGNNQSFPNSQRQMREGRPVTQNPRMTEAHFNYLHQNQHIPLVSRVDPLFMNDLKTEGSNFRQKFLAYNFVRAVEKHPQLFSTVDAKTLMGFVKYGYQFGPDRPL